MKFMRVSALSALFLSRAAANEDNKPPVTSEGLQELITERGLDRRGPKRYGHN